MRRPARIILVMSDGMVEAIEALAVQSISAERLSGEEPLPGVHALDLWRDGSNGAMLFWVDAGANLNGQQEPVLFEVRAKLTDGVWRAARGMSATTGPLEEVSARSVPGLQYVSRSSQDGVFLTLALATPEVAVIRLEDDSGRVRDRPPGRHGRVLLGVTSEDPLTQAYALDYAGQRCATEPLTLWAPPSA